MTQTLVLSKLELNDANLTLYLHLLEGISFYNLYTGGLRWDLFNLVYKPLTFDFPTAHEDSYKRKL